MDKFKYELGLKAKDIITGLEGIIVGRIQYLYGCNQYGIKPSKLHDDKPMDTYYVDEGRIKAFKCGGINPKKVRVKTPGADTSDAPSDQEGKK